jgi:D-arabinose 1-dehydrogenase-like Zn-dependent alcohol dehydrogenase
MVRLTSLICRNGINRNLEIIGHVVATGPKVTSVKIGNRVGDGAQISAYLDCPQCKNDNETYCKEQQGSVILLAF